MAWLTPMVALVLLAIVAGIIGIGSMYVLNGPIKATTTFGDFTLTLTSAKARYRTGEAVVIGDNLASDIAGARAVGARSILMLTGVTTSEMVERVPAGERPTAIARDAAELARTLSSW